MIVPAVDLPRLQPGGDGATGWGIPMATDIAFALGVVSVLGSRVPPRLKVFLLTLAIVDDIGAIVVIAIFYTESLAFDWLALAVALLVVVVGLQRAQVRYVPVYVAVGIVVWLAMFESGVHATIAGVILGLITPARPFQPEIEAETIVDRLGGPRPDLRAEDVRETSLLIRESVPISERIEHALHPWTSFVVIPIFALANAGVRLSAEPLRDASPVLVGRVLWLVVGKLIGVTSFTWLATRIRGVDLPEGVRWIAGGRASPAVAGIGFSVLPLHHRPGVRRRGPAGRRQDRHPPRQRGGRHRGLGDPRRGEPLPSGSTGRAVAQGNLAPRPRVRPRRYAGVS